MNDSTIHYFRFLAHPKPSNAEYGVVDGAWVSCWVLDPVLASAEAEARDVLEEAGWDVELLEESSVVDENNIPQSAASYIDQVRQDGLVAVFNTWDVGAPDE